MAKGKKASRRGKAPNLNYKSANRHEKSHCRRIKKHLDRYGHDKVAVNALVAYATKAGTGTFVKFNSWLKTKGWG